MVLTTCRKWVTQSLFLSVCNSVPLLYSFYLLAVMQCLASFTSSFCCNTQSWPKHRVKRQNSISNNTKIKDEFSSCLVCQVFFPITLSLCNCYFNEISEAYYLSYYAMPSFLHYFYTCHRVTRKGIKFFCTSYILCC